MEDGVAAPRSGLFVAGDSKTRVRALCGRSQAAIEDGDFAGATRYAREALTIASDDEAVARHAACVFGITGESDLLIVALESLDTRHQLSAAQHRLLSSLYTTKGLSDLSLRHALKASDSEVGDAEYARNCGAMLISEHRPGEACLYLVRAARLNPSDAVTQHLLSVSCGAIGRDSEALAFAAKAYNLEQSNPDYLERYASLLLHNARYKDAVAFLQEAQGSRQLTTATHLLLLSIGYSQVGEYIASVAAAEEGLLLAHDRIDLLMQRGVVLCCLGRYQQAVEDFEKVLSIDPNNLPAKRSYFAAVTELGLYGAALPVGGDLIRAFPEDDGIGRTVLHILTRRYQTTTVSNVADGLGLYSLKQQQPRRVRPRPTFATGLATQLRVLGAMMLREMKTRFGHSKLGYLWALLEPIIHISTLVVIIQSLAHGSPPIGDSYAVFYFTGIIPYHLFTHTASQLMSAVPGNRPMLQLPPVTTLDVFVSRGLVELSTEIAVAGVLLSAFSIMGFQAIPEDPLRFALAFLAIWLCGFGMGMINAVFSAYLPSWEKLWGSIISLLYFTSGIFYVPEMMPEWVRDALSWNPLLQGIEMVRSAFFHDHVPPWLDVRYLLTASICFVLTGLFLESVARRKLLEPR